MIDDEGANSTVLFINKRIEKRNLKTQNSHDLDFNEKYPTKWCENTFYLDVRKRIHQKLKTEPPAEHGRNSVLKNAKFSNLKPKSKITVSTLQIAIDPTSVRPVQETFQIERKIYHKTDSNVSLIKAKSTKIPRNMSAKLVRDKPLSISNSSRSLIKNQLTQTCRKNSKPYGMNDLDKQEKKIKHSGKNIPMKIFEEVKLSDQKQQFDDGFTRLRKSKSQISKKSPIKLQTFDTNPLLFYFKVKNKFKPENRQTGIQKLRIRTKQLKGFVGVP